MFKRVEVTFTNKDKVEETAKGRLLAWYNDGDSYTVSFIVLDDGRFVTSGYGVSEHEATRYIELVESNIEAPSYNPYFKTTYDPFTIYSNLKVIDNYV